MLDFITNTRNKISKKVQNAHKAYKTHAENTCNPLINYQECIKNKNKKNLEGINKNYKNILDIHSKIEKPDSYTKVLNRYYHTGVLNKTNGSICNNNLNNASFINKYKYAKINSASLTGGPEIKVQGHHIDCSNKCKSKENFGNFSTNTSCHNNKKIVNILLLVLLIICLIPYLYFFIKQFMGKGKKKY